MEAARPALATDLPALVALAGDAVDEQRHTRGGPVWFRREARVEPEATLEAALDDPEQHVLLGTVDEAPVGYGVVRVEELRTGERLAVVEDLYVEPEARGVGVGEALMDALVAWAEQQGCIGIDALALPGNRATKNFFESFGLTARAIVVHRALGEAASD